MTNRDFRFLGRNKNAENASIFRYEITSDNRDYRK